MKARSRGFGLVEIMVALVLGLVVSAGVVQIFVASRGTFLSQNSAARMQEDARFVLSKMLQELRMTGMYGCLGTGSYALAPVLPEISRAATVALDNPILWNSATQVLTIVTADIGASGSNPTWTILSDCQGSSQLFAGSRAAGNGQTAFALRQLIYTFSDGTLNVRAAGGQNQPLLKNISSFDVTFGLAGTPMTYVNAVSLARSADIRSVRLRLVMTDPNGRVEDQSYSVVAYLRNRF